MPAHNGTDTPTDIQVGPPPPNAELAEQLETELNQATIGAAGAGLGAVGMMAAASGGDSTAVGAIVMKAAAFGGGSAALIIAFVFTLAAVAYTLWNLKQARDLLRNLEGHEPSGLFGGRPSRGLGFVSSAAAAGSESQGASSPAGKEPCKLAFGHKHNIKGKKQSDCPDTVQAGYRVTFYKENSDDVLVERFAPFHSELVILVEGENGFDIKFQPV